MASGSTNMYDLLNNDEQHSKKPREHEGPGKPDKTEQRRSVPREQKQNPSGNPSSHPAHQRNRVDDRDRRGGRGGASRGGRGGRGGYHGGNSDGVHRNFDRKQGEHHKHAPGEARKHGAVGEANPSAFTGSSEEFQAQDAAATADANGDIVGDEILDITPMPTDPDDGKLTYDEFLAQRAAPEDDVNRNIREVDDGSAGDFQKAKKLVKEEVGLFGEVIRNDDDDADAADRRAGGKKNKKNKISLDEFVGAGAASSSSPSERGGRGGASSGRGGRGGFQGDSAPRGGRGGFDGNRGGRGGRGGFDGPRGGARGGNSSNQQRGGARGGRAPAANVNLADQSAFPALSPK